MSDPWTAAPDDAGRGIGSTALVVGAIAIVLLVALLMTRGGVARKSFKDSCREVPGSPGVCATR